MDKREGGAGVACRLVVGGVEYTFTLEGPLVALAPAPKKTAKKQSKRGRK